VKNGRRYDTNGLLEAQFAPGSDNKVLHNLLGVTDAEEMARIETRELARVTEKFLDEVETDQSFTFREGNGRIARLLALLMGLQAGLPPLDFSVIDGEKRESYFAAVRDGMDRNYAPMAAIFAEVIRRSLVRAAGA
jgi:hypothetical protein